MPIEITAGDPAARAKAAADLKYGGQEAAIQRAIAALATSRTADQAAIDSYGAGGRAGIDTAYNQLDTNLEANRQMVNRDLGIQVDAIGQGYRQAQDIANAAATQASGGIQNMMNNNSAYSTVQFDDATRPIANLAARLIGESANSDATYTGNLRNWAAQQNALMQSGQASAQRERASSKGGFERELLNALSSSKNQRSQEEFDFQGQLLDLLNERSSFEATSTSDFLDQLFNQKLQAANYNLQEQQMLMDAAYKQAALAASGGGGGGGGGSDSDLAERKFQFEMEKYNQALSREDQALLREQLAAQHQQNIENAPRTLNNVSRAAALAFKDTLKKAAPTLFGPKPGVSSSPSTKPSLNVTGKGSFWRGYSSPADAYNER